MATFRENNLLPYGSNWKYVKNYQDPILWTLEMNGVLAKTKKHSFVCEGRGACGGQRTTLSVVCQAWSTSFYETVSHWPRTHRVSWRVSSRVSLVPLSGLGLLVGTARPWFCFCSGSVLGVYLGSPDCQGSTLVTEPPTTPALLLKVNIRVENNLLVFFFFFVLNPYLFLGSTMALKEPHAIPVTTINFGYQ